MKYIYEVDLGKFNLSDAEVNKLTANGQKSLFETFLTGLFSTKYPDGVKGMTVRCLNKFLEKLDKSEKGVIELDDKDVDLLKEVLLSDLTIHPGQVRYFMALQQNLEKAMEESKLV